MFRYFAHVLLTAATTFGASAQDPGKDGDDALKPKAPKIRKISELELQINQIRIHKKTRAITFPARVEQDSVQLEYAIVTADRGKIHESLLATDISPFNLQVAFKLLGYTASQRDIWPEDDEEGNQKGPMKVDDKGGIHIQLAWKQDGGKKTAAMNDWIVNLTTKNTLGKHGLIYTGSVVDGGYYMAEIDGSIAAVYRYQGAMINAFDADTDNDEVWFPATDKMPPVGTPVEVTITPLPLPKTTDKSNKPSTKQ